MTHNPQPNAKPCRVLVLGASGFLGSSVASHLANQGYETIAYWRRPSHELIAHPNITSVVGDLRDTWTLADALSGVDIVYHFASATHPSLFFNNASAEYWEALQPLMVLIESAARVGVKKIVYPSSGGTIYADSKNPRVETSATDPRSPYAIFKLTGEQLLRHAADAGRFNVDIFRIGNPYGPRQRPRPGQGVLPHWLEAIREQRPIQIYGDGTASRDYVYIDDVCRIMETSIDRLCESEVLNLGSGVATSLNELARVLRDKIELPIEVQYLDARPADIQSVVLSPARVAQRIPGFKFCSIETGIDRLLALV